MQSDGTRVGSIIVGGERVVVDGKLVTGRGKGKDKKKRVWIGDLPGWAQAKIEAAEPGSIAVINRENEGLIIKDNEAIFNGAVVITEEMLEEIEQAADET